MAFTCKFPISRRQVWENSHTASQFRIEQFDRPNALDELASVDSNIEKRHQHDIRTVTTGTPCSISSPSAAASAGCNDDAHSHTTTTAATNDNLRGYKRHQSDSNDTTDAFKFNPQRSGALCSEELVPEKIRFSKCDILFIVASILTYYVDVGLDCSLAYKHWLNRIDKPLYFGFTVTFILLAGIVSSIFSLWWYYFEYISMKKDGLRELLPSRLVTVFRVIACIFMMGPVVRYIDTIRFGIKSRQGHLKPKQRRWFFEQMQFERVDGAMLRMIEGFLEAAPQLLLQVYIVLQQGLEGEKEGNYFLVIVTILSIISSMGSLSWAIVAYHKALRMSRNDRDNISHFGLFFRFVWRLFEVSPRVIILAMFMSKFHYYIGVFIAGHWAVMLLWLSRMTTHFCEHPNCEGLFIIVAALIWTFCFFNVKDGHTRKTSLVYYTLFYIENVTLTVIWLCWTLPTDYAYNIRWILTGVALGSMWVSVIAMLIYYKCLHPHPIKTCLPMSYWLSFKNNSYRCERRNTNSDGNATENVPLDPTQGQFDTPLEITRQQSQPNTYTDDNLDDALSAPPPSYRAPTPELILRPLPDQPVSAGDDGEYTGYTHLDMEAEEDLPTLALNSHLVIERGDDGYLKPDSEQSFGLQRQDSVPNYRAPVPVPTKSNYGATVPGGAPNILKLHKRGDFDVKRGRTLPGAAPVPVLVQNPNMNNIHHEHKSSETPEQTLASRERTPMPLPRISKIESTPQYADTEITDSDNTVSFLHSSPTVPTPSPRHSQIINGNDANNSNNTDLSLDNSVLDSTVPSPATQKPTHLHTQVLIKNTSLVYNSDVDTPLKDDGNTDIEILSPDTPMRECQVSRKKQP